MISRAGGSERCAQNPLLMLYLSDGVWYREDVGGAARFFLNPIPLFGVGNCSAGSCMPAFIPVEGGAGWRTTGSMPGV